MHNKQVGIARLEPFKLTDLPNYDEGHVQDEAGKGVVIKEVQKVMATVSWTYTNCTLNFTLAEAVFMYSGVVFSLLYCMCDIVRSLSFIVHGLYNT